MFLTNAVRNLDYHTIEAAKNMGAFTGTILFKNCSSYNETYNFCNYYSYVYCCFEYDVWAVDCRWTDFQTINPMIKTFANMTGSRDICSIVGNHIRNCYFNSSVYYAENRKKGKLYFYF